MLPKPPIAYLTTRSAVSAVSRLLPFALTPFCSCQERGGVHRRALSREELVATKLRALLQRNKGRDLLDLFQALGHSKLFLHVRCLRPGRAAHDADQRHEHGG